MTDAPAGSAVPAPDASPQALEYMRLWAQSMAQVLGQIAGSPLNVECLPQPPTAVPAAAENDVWVSVTAEGALQGEMSLRLPAASTLALAQLFLSESQDAAAAWKAEYREAVEELFRQVAGHAATALKPRWGEVQLRAACGIAPSWPPAAGGWLGSGSAAPIAILSQWQLNAALGEALLASSPEPVSPETAAPPDPAESGAAGNASEGNFDLLMDVELEVMLRFGERSMLLREILELGSGSVVELDRRIEEPVDLLLEGKIIARGEVVVVDGNYGLRVLEVRAAQPAG